MARRYRCQARCQGLSQKPLRDSQGDWKTSSRDHQLVSLLSQEEVLMCELIKIQLRLGRDKLTEGKPEAGESLCAKIVNSKNFEGCTFDEYSLIDRQEEI
jgi:hypothetical protein